jgi:hypothetical protein
LLGFSASLALQKEADYSESDYSKAAFFLQKEADYSAWLAVVWEPCNMLQGSSNLFTISSAQQ